MADFALAVSDQRAGALEVWRAANLARGLTPTPVRVARVREKLDDGSACLVVGTENIADVIAMALAEPAREQHGAGAIHPTAGHVSMVFVDPRRWGSGIGAALLDALHDEMRTRGWTTASLWTRASNARARRLYEGRGYRRTADLNRLLNGDQILRYQSDLYRLACGPGQACPSASLRRADRFGLC